MQVSGTLFEASLASISAINVCDYDVFYSKGSERVQRVGTPAVGAPGSGDEVSGGRQAPATMAPALCLPDAQGAATTAGQQVAAVRRPLQLRHPL